MDVLEVTDSPTGIAAAVWLVVIVLAAIIGIIAYMVNRMGQPFRMEAVTSHSPSEALDHLEQRLLRQGWSLAFRDDRDLMLSRQRAPTRAGSARRGCLWRIMAVANFLASQTTVTLHFSAAETASGTLIVATGTRSGDFVRGISKLLQSLPKPA